MHNHPDYSIKLVPHPKAARKTDLLQGFQAVRLTIIHVLMAAAHVIGKGMMRACGWPLAIRVVRVSGAHACSCGCTTSRCQWPSHQMPEWHGYN